jgi:hypothetical protein
VVTQFIQKEKKKKNRRMSRRRLKVALISINNLALLDLLQFVELIVNATISHKPKRGDGPVRYHVLWSDGSTSFEPVTQLYDTDDDEKFIFNRVLLEYWKRNPSVRVRDGFEDPEGSEEYEDDGDDNDMSDQSDRDF